MKQLELHIQFISQAHKPEFRFYRVHLPIKLNADVLML